MVYLCNRIAFRNSELMICVTVNVGPAYEKHLLFYHSIEQSRTTCPGAAPLQRDWALPHQLLISKCLTEILAGQSNGKNF